MSKQGEVGEAQVRHVRRSEPQEDEARAGLPEG